MGSSGLAHCIPAPRLIAPGHQLREIPSLDAAGEGDVSGIVRWRVERSEADAAQIQRITGIVRRLRSAAVHVPADPG